MSIRNERIGDGSKIEEITRLAFKGKPYASGTEQYLAEKLRSSNALTLSLVAESSGAVVGHIAVSPVTINGENGLFFGVGPLVVEPRAQGLGYGTSLLTAALDYLRSIGAKCCILVGDPNYYSRLGFCLETDLTYQGASAEYFQSIWFSEQKLVGEVEFHEAFE